MSETPWCDCVGSERGFTNAKFDETGELKDQWLHAECLRPARMIFDATERWADERAQYYGTSARHDRTAVRHDDEPRRDQPLADAGLRIGVGRGEVLPNDKIKPELVLTWEKTAADGGLSPLLTYVRKQ